MKYFRINLEDKKSLQYLKCLKIIIILKDTKISAKILKQIIPQNHFRRHKIIDANIMCQN